MSTETPEEAPKLYAAREPVFPKRVKGNSANLMVVNDFHAWDILSNTLDSLGPWP